jgi:hypothetical protein
MLSDPDKSPLQTISVQHRRSTHRVRLHLQRFQNEHRLSEVPSRVLRNLLRHFHRQVKADSLGNIPKYGLNLSPKTSTGGAVSIDLLTSSELGAATRINRHRLLIGAISRLVLFAQRIIRMLDMYFSIVRRSAACASLDSESASLIITTLNRCFALRSTGCVCAISLRRSWITTLS